MLNYQRVPPYVGNIQMLPSKNRELTKSKSLLTWDFNQQQIGALSYNNFVGEIQQKLVIQRRKTANHVLGKPTRNDQQNWRLHYYCRIWLTTFPEMLPTKQGIWPAMMAMQGEEDPKIQPASGSIMILLSTKEMMYVIYPPVYKKPWETTFWIGQSS